MSRNADIIDGIYDDWGRGDFSRIDWASQDFELVLADGPTAGSAKGLEAAGRLWGQHLTAFEDFRTLVEEIEVIGEDCVLILTTNTGRGKTSGMEVGRIATQGANVLHLRDGKVTKLVAYWDRERARAELAR